MEGSVGTPKPLSKPITFVCRLVLAVALRHILPAHARTQNPKHAMHEPPVIFCRPANRSYPSRQQWFDAPPLNRRQLIATY